MKNVKRILAVMLAAVMLVSTCAVAASAAQSLQDAIDAAAAGSTVTMQRDATESVVIDKDLTLDLGGHQLTGAEGQPAITIIGADVTVTNGHVYSKFANVRTVTMIETVKNQSPAAISVKGGSVTVKGVRAVGSFTRIPGQSKYALPTGSAVALTNGANATVIQSSLVGRYGVNNSVTGKTAGGTVTVQDAIMMGFMKAVKDTSKEVLDNAEKVNAADRIEGFLNDGVRLEARERALMKKILADRVMIYTQKVSGEAAVCTVETAPCPSTSTTALVKANEDTSRLWSNDTSTDCSYKYVPEYAVLSDGTLVALTRQNDAYTAQIDAGKSDGVRIQYRLEFAMQPDIKRYATNFDRYLQKLYDLVITTADALYEELADKYDTYVAMVGDLFDRVDEMGMTRIMGQKLENAEIYQRLVHALLELGGETMYYNGDTTQHFGAGQLYYFYGDEDYQLPDGAYYGVLDHVAELKAELEAIKGASFADQSMWGDLGCWFYENYRDVIVMLDDVAAKIDNLQAVLADDLIQAAIRQSSLASKQETLNKIETLIDDARKVIATLLQSRTVSDVLSKLDSHPDEIKPYINKFIFIYNHRDRYFTPDNFLDGNFAKAYALRKTAAVQAVTENRAHAWDDGEELLPADCVEEGEILYTCAQCGATRTETIRPTGHNWGDWTGVDTHVHAHICSNTGCPVGRETEPHDYLEDTDAYVAPTVTTEGLRRYVCSVCGAERNEIIPVVPHDHVYDEDVTPPTCTEGGYTTFTCSVCGDTYVGNETGATGHHWDSGAVTQAATCMASGVMTYTCQNDPEHTYTEEIRPDPDAHVWDTEITEPTCTEQGYTTLVCAYCFETYVGDYTDARGHDWEDRWEDETDAQHVHICKRDPSHKQYEDHNFVLNTELSRDASCDIGGLTVYDCSVCGRRREETSAELGHRYNAVVTEPTCTEQGYTTYTCSHCGEFYIDDEVPALDHSYRYVTTWETCTEDGYTTFTCTRCGDTFVSEETPATGHDWDDGVVTTAPTCTAAGVKTYTCRNNSEHTYTAPIPSDPDAHVWDTEITEPTCTEQGYTTFVCAYCFETYVGDYTDARGHDWEDRWEDETDEQHVLVCKRDPSHKQYEDHDFVLQQTLSSSATCDIDGLNVYLCSVCGHLKEEVVTELGHDYDAVVTEPTCTEQGYTTYTCSRCGEFFIDDEVPALDHSYSYVTTWETCTEDGYTTFTCTRCGDTFVSEETPATGHAWNDGAVTTGPTCTTTGVRTYTCQNDPTHTYTETIGALGHAYDSVVTDPTCTERGYTTHTCSRCQDSYVDAYTDALGHNFGDWTETTAPTCTTAGEETRYCSRCDATETQPVGALGHAYDSVVTDPTCTEQGYTTHTCSRCQDSYVDAYTDALGHDWDDGVVTAEPTETEEGVMTYTCRRCRETRTEPIPKLEPEQLLLHSTAGDKTGTALEIRVPYARRGKIATTLTANKNVTYTSSNPKFLTVDADGNVRMVRLCIFCRSATITAKSADGGIATCKIDIQLKWYHYLLWLIFGSFWF